MTDTVQGSDDVPPTFARSVGGRLGSPRPREILLALIIGVAVAAAGAASILSRDAIYVSRTSLLIDQPRAIAASSDEGLILKLERLRVKYSGLVASTQIAGPVARRLGLPELFVMGSVRPIIVPFTLVLAIETRMRDPVLARRVSFETAQELISYVQREFQAIKPTLPEVQQFRFFLIGEASPAIKVSPTWQRATAVAVVGGLLAAAGVYVLVRLRPWRRREN